MRHSDLRSTGLRGRTDSGTPTQTNTNRGWNHKNRGLRETDLAPNPLLSGARLRPDENILSTRFFPKIQKFPTFLSLLLFIKHCVLLLFFKFKSTSIYCKRT